MTQKTSLAALTAAIAILLGALLCACGSRDITSYGGASIEEVKSAVKGEIKFDYLEDRFPRIVFDEGAVFCGITASDPCEFLFSEDGKFKEVYITADYKSNQDALDKAFADMAKRYGKPTEIPEEDDGVNGTLYKFKNGFTDVAKVRKGEDGKWSLEIYYFKLDSGK